jgi:hypothetical protein
VVDDHIAGDDDDVNEDDAAVVVVGVVVGIHWSYSRVMPMVVEYLDIVADVVVDA